TSYYLFAQRHDPDAGPGMRFRVLRRNPLADYAHLRRGLLYADSRFEPAYDIGSVQVAAAELRLAGRERPPHLGPAARRELRIRRQHADDGVLTAAECERLAYNGPIAAEAPLPQSVTQQYNPGRPGGVFSRLKGASDDRLYA